MIASFTAILLPQFAGVVSGFAPIFQGLGEGPMVLWLLITGIRATSLARTEIATTS